MLHRHFLGKKAGFLWVSNPRPYSPSSRVIPINHPNCTASTYSRVPSLISEKESSVVFVRLYLCENKQCHFIRCNWSVTFMLVFIVSFQSFCRTVKSVFSVAVNILIGFSLVFFIILSEKNNTAWLCLRAFQYHVSKSGQLSSYLLYLIVF